MIEHERADERACAVQEQPPGAAQPGEERSAESGRYDERDQHVGGREVVRRVPEVADRPDPGYLGELERADQVSKLALAREGAGARQPLHRGDDRGNRAEGSGAREEARRS